MLSSALGSRLASGGLGHEIEKGGSSCPSIPGWSLAPNNAPTLIQKRLNDYLSIRFDQAIRINPRLRTLKQDLTYHEVESLRACLMGEKIFGTTRLLVANILMATTRKKRRGLLSATDQTSISRAGQPRPLRPSSNPRAPNSHS